MQADGRWNRPGEYGCLYTSLSREGATAELRKVLASMGLTEAEAAPRDLVAIGVDVTPVLDLSDSTVCSAFGVAAEQIVRDDVSGIELCRSVADLARAQGYNALLSPSAAAPMERNLSIYLDARPADVHLRATDIREPLG